MASLNQEDIDTLVAVSGNQVDRDQAAQVLKISSNNVETAMNKIFDALERPNGITELVKQGDTTWDGTAFGGLSGYGPYQEANTNNNLPTFHIDATNVDDPNSGGFSAAPTRPPSRNSQRPGSAMSTHMGDVPMQSSFYSEDGSWHNIEPLTGFPGVESGQDSGVVGNAGTAGVLRPATQNYYDSASWALVPATKSTEYIPDASLHDQIRKEKPGFIKPTVSDNHLPALITMLHSIPLIRNTLLAPEISAGNYWRGEDWWKGNASASSIIVSDDIGSEAGSELELLYEVQRLMAFLDSSERTYASLESLIQLDAWAQPRFSSPDEPTQNDLVKFLMRWSSMYRNHASTASLKGILCSDVNVNGKEQGSHVLEVEMGSIDTISTEPTLYDYIDELLFTEFGSAHITKPSSVLVLSLEPKGSKRNCKIPAILYADRYLEENRPTVEANFTNKKKYTEILLTLDAKVEDLKYHTPQKVQYPKKMETLTLLKNSMRAFESETEAMTESLRDVAVLDHLQSLYAKVERQLSELEEQKKKAKEALDGVAELFRAPLEEANSETDTTECNTQHKFNHPYRLCGVAKSKTEYYICHPVKEPGHLEKDHAWWHIKYDVPNSSSGSEEPASIIRDWKDITDVLEDVSTISESTVLVYANDAAFLPSLTSLSPKLETFVKKDNLNFQQKVATAEAAWLNQGQNEASQKDWFEGGDGWDNDEIAKQGYQKDTFGSTLSSKTLTPDTDPNPPAYHDEDDVVNITLSPEHESEQPMEMQEINGGISAWAGASNASSETVGLEPMSDIVPSDGRQSRAKNRAEDVLMEDAETDEEGKTEHIEVLKKKGG
ncbi:uncharacterized protein N0V89_005548 [Didymosphaeria variabile]|uniref:UBA domain-containing protein n=1 Tax=Didymosphaeria variabile TaxID=1932322 RepID=A0A9W8XMF7_9PLEO|nr:uncharacterized protein N0V89_005548 [Didymosphaeria variabile]KAJ4353818.1 hypothetical protein N0V89_005548 [Didymosphaeria variabile]